MIHRFTLPFLFLVALAPVAFATQLQTSPAAPPTFDPELFRVDLQPVHLASTSDAWNDFADRWRYRSTISLWMAGVEGTVGKGNFESDVDVSFADLFDKLTIGAGLNFEVGKGPFSVLVFAQYQHFKADATTPLGFDGDASAQFGLVDIALAYQILNVPVGSEEARFSVEAMVGFRWTYLSTEVELNEGPRAGESESREKNWFDPYVGARLRYDFSRNLNISGIGTIGGFGVGSDIAWSAYGQLEYRFNEKWSFILGYRAIGYDYEDDGFKFDVTMHGPVIGLSIRM